MLLTTALSCFLAFWSLLFLTDFYLRANAVHWYINFADHIGLSVSFFQVCSLYLGPFSSIFPFRQPYTFYPLGILRIIVKKPDEKLGCRFSELSGMEGAEIRFYTNRFHQSLLYQPLAASSPSKYSLISRAVSVWFTVGATVSLICFFGVTIFLTKLLWDVFAPWWPSYPYPEEQLVPPVFHLNQVKDHGFISHTQRQTESEVGLTPIVPGVNIPWEHVPLFLLVLTIVGVVHELGHAMAAVDANVPVSGFGIFLIAVYPGAFTEMQTDALGRSSSAQKMRIFGAGIWHNLVLAFFGYLLYLVVPYVLAPLYLRGNGVYIRVRLLLQDVDLRSGLSGMAGLRKNDVVYNINGCATKSTADWYKCLAEIKGTKVGFCVPNEKILPGLAKKVETFGGEMHCCDEFQDVSLSHICFYFKNVSAAVKKKKFLFDFPLSRGVTLAPNLAESLGFKAARKRDIKALERKSNFILNRNARKVEQGSKNFDAFAFLSKPTAIKKTQDEKYACLPARLVTDYETCKTPLDCAGYPNGPQCAFPALFNGTLLLRINVGNTSRPILFIGTTDELVYFVKLSDYIPLYFFAFPWLPYASELVSKYLVTFSLAGLQLAKYFFAAVALLNAVPCYGLDGQFISETVIESVFAQFSTRRRLILHKFLVYYGVAILSGNLLVGFVRFLRPYLT
ncbi:unnamed protein product [Enterobius vermicularis]|uniref:Membrane-bound transcription factor site-2 protease n=1 Tax=Enterobius vermicularis TaxID=51028 RepID=A0A0N4VDM8_ENTVE|nr:unnamed protein product [Enterobius vermicularis]